MTTIEKMRAARAGEITVRTWWGCPGLSGEAFRSWFLDCLMAKINRHDRRQGRRLTPEYQASLYRDAQTAARHPAAYHPPAIRDRHLPAPLRPFANPRLTEVSHVRTRHHQSLPGRSPLRAGRARSPAAARGMAGAGAAGLRQAAAGAQERQPGAAPDQPVPQRRGRTLRQPRLSRQLLAAISSKTCCCTSSPMD